MLEREDQRLSIFRQPHLYTRDKYRILKHDPTRVMKPIIIWVVTTVGFVSACHGLFQLKIEALDIVFATLIFLIGCYAVIQSTSIYRYEIRLSREIKSFYCLHEIAHIFRAYRAFKIRKQKDGIPVYDRRTIFDTINRICDKLISDYLRPRHGPTVSLCVKYHQHDKMYGLRYGNRAESNDPTPEDREECFVYKRLLRDKNIKFLHVPDTEDEASTLRALGDNAEVIRHRAKKQGYRSFWAMPINTGNTHLEDSTLIAKIPLGFLGCDMPYSYGFGNISEQEKEFLAIIVDAMSELLYDLNFADNTDHGNEGNNGH